MRAKRIFATAVLAAFAGFALTLILPTSFQFQAIILYTIAFAIFFTAIGTEKTWKAIPYSALTVLIAIAIALITILTVGWLVYQSSPYEVHVTNTDFREHNVTVKVYCDGKLLFGKSYLMRPKSHVKSDLPKGFFTPFPQHLEVTLDGKIKKTYNLGDYGYVRIGIVNESGKLELRIGQLVPD